MYMMLHVQVCPQNSNSPTDSTYMYVYRYLPRIDSRIAVVLANGMARDKRERKMVKRGKGLDHDRGRAKRKLSEPCRDASGLSTEGVGRVGTGSEPRDKTGESWDRERSVGGRAKSAVPTRQAE